MHWQHYSGLKEATFMPLPHLVLCWRLPLPLESGQLRGCGRARHTLAGDQENPLDLLWICRRVGGQRRLFREQACSCGMQPRTHLGHLPERAFISLRSPPSDPPAPVHATALSIHSALPSQQNRAALWRHARCWRRAQTGIPPQLPLSAKPDECLQVPDKSQSLVPLGTQQQSWFNISGREHIKRA